MTEEKHINPEDYADDRRVSYLVLEYKRLTQAEVDAQDLLEVDPTMTDLVEKEIKMLEFLVFNYKL